MSVYDDLMQGLQEALDYTKGKPTGVKRRSVTIKPLPKYQAQEVKQIRQNLQLTQTSFANLMGVSRKTIEAWEAGTNIPQGSSQRLLEIICKDTSVVQEYVNR